MDINALLSPTESPVPESPPSAYSSSRKVRPSGGKRTTSALSQEVTLSPSRSHIASDPSSLPSSATASPTSFPAYSATSAPTFRPLYQAPTSNPSPTPPLSGHGYDQSQHRPIVTHRQSSTPQMDTLADLAAMQQRHPPTYLYPRSPTSSRTFDASRESRSPAVDRSMPPPPPPQVFRTTSGQSLADLTMAEAPAETPPPRKFESSALSEPESKTVHDLLSYLSENSYAYDSHVELINLLHKGFLAHVNPPAASPDDTLRDPGSYSLLNELRQAREAMDTRFAVGEDLWMDWLSDEMVMASSSEQRIAVTELCQRAVQDEPASVKLWETYADWVSSNYAVCNNFEEADPKQWSEEDKEVCKALFTRDMVGNVLEQAVAATQRVFDRSHALWDRCAQLVQEDFPASPTSADISKLKDLFIRRLQIPHSAWDQTASIFWPIVSKYEGSNWEAVMAEINEMTSPVKQQVGLREEHESKLQRAIDSADNVAIFNEFSAYLAWEKKQTRKTNRKNKAPQPSFPETRFALYERALLRLPTYTDWWLDYIDDVTSSETSTSALSLIERATRHCPWSGDLWSRRILQLDVEHKSYQEIEATKHRATNSGLLDVGGMEEMLKVLQQWCSYLRRHAFSTANAEDDVDTAEVGIMMALEDIQQAGTKVYGKDFEGDPLYRLETIQMKFLSEARRFEDARAIYRSLVPKQKHSFVFWSKYYNWELWLWGYDRIVEKHRIETPNNGPDKATAVLKEALAQRNLDEPDKVLDMYLNHFQQHESGERLRSAIIDAREFSKYLAIRRSKEAEQAAAVAPQLTNEPVVEDNATVGEKRKRDEEALPNGHSDKKTKTAAESATLGDPSASVTAQIKRDRENNTVTLKNLPADVQELDVKKLFRDIAAPLSITILRETETAIATVEFESQEDAAFAKTRSGTQLGGNEISIQSGSQSTLYVANYPAEYDEVAVRELFKPYGDIVSVRFPSLKFNNRRHFCYVQFVTAEMAKAAESALDGKMLGSWKLLAKIADPDAKKKRSSAMEEGREVFVKNIDRSLSDDQVRKHFGQYGNVLTMNSLKNASGQKLGTAFIVFEKGDEAKAALGANNKPLSDRILHVELATPKGRADPRERAHKEDIIVKHTGSATPEPDALNGRRDSDVSMDSSARPADDDSYKTVKERKVAIFNLPDTVNDARIQAAMEKHGPLVKIQIRRDKEGAIVEFATVNDAFNVRQGVDCSALGPEVETGDVADLLAKAKKPKAQQGMRAPPISRPGQGGGRRGGLGFSKKGLGFGAARSAEGGAKSNADFREMLDKSKAPAADEQQDAADG